MAGDEARRGELDDDRRARRRARVEKSRNPRSRDFFSM
jgi:hypothetical protein